MTTADGSKYSRRYSCSSSSNATYTGTSGGVVVSSFFFFFFLSALVEVLVCLVMTGQGSLALIKEAQMPYVILGEMVVVVVH